MVRWSLALGLTAVGPGCGFDSGGLGSASAASVGTESTSGFTESATTDSNTFSATATSMTSGSASTTTTSTMSGNPTTATTGGTTEATTMGQESTGSTTGGQAGLVSRGVLARYFLDEAASGQGPTTALDHSGNGFDLPIVHSTINQYTQVDGQRGMEWTSPGGGGVISSVIDGTVVGNQLEGSTAGTIEVVVDIDAVDASGSRLSHIGVGGNSDFSIASANIGSLAFRLTTDANNAFFNVDFLTLDRCVLQAVYDSNEPAAADRLRLYVNGSEVFATNVTPIPLGTTISFLDGAAYTIGNRQDGVRSFDGVLFYAALYDVALTPAEAQGNAEILAGSDDAP